MLLLSLKDSMELKYIFIVMHVWMLCYPLSFWKCNFLIKTTNQHILGENWVTDVLQLWFTDRMCQLLVFQMVNWYRQSCFCFFIPLLTPLRNTSKVISCSEKSYMALSTRIPWLWIRAVFSNCTTITDHWSYRSLCNLSTSQSRLNTQEWNGFNWLLCMHSVFHFSFKFFQFLS